MGGLSLATKGVLCSGGICDATAVIVSGEIEIEPNRWQLIAIPCQYGFWRSTEHKIVNDGSTISKVKNYIISQIEDKYVGGGESIGDYVEIVNTYFGDDNAFRTWNETSPPPDSSPHNFPLVYVDGARKEVAGIWVKSVASIPLILEWSA